MKEKKFRAWDKKNKRWVKPEYLQNPKIMSIDLTEEGFKFKDAGFIFCQFIEKKDDKGKEICEGDIIKRTWRLAYWDSPTTEIFAVGSEECPLTNCEWIDEFEEEDYSIYDKSIEIIGNIYENPELLEIKK